MLRDGRGACTQKATCAHKPGGTIAVKQRDLLGVGQYDEIGVVGRKRDLPPTLVLQQRRREGVSDVSVVQIVLRLVDD